MEESHNGYQQEMTLRDYTRMVFRHWPVFVCTVIVVLGTVYSGLELRTPVYVAQVKMLISAEKETQAPYSRELVGYDKSQLNLTQAEIVKSTPVLERAVKVTKLDERPLDYEKQYASKLRSYYLTKMVQQYREALGHMPEDQRKYILFRRAVDQLRASITVEPIRDTSLFTINVRDFDPGVAAALANVVSRSYVIFDLEQQLAEMGIKYGDLHPAVSLLKSQIDRMVQSLSGAPLENIEAIGPATIKIINQASVPLRPEGRSKSLLLLLAGVLAVFMGLIFSFIFEFLDQTVRSPRDLIGVLPVPILGKIPLQRNSQPKLMEGDKPASVSYTSAYHELACQIRFFVNQKKMKIFLFTAPDGEEGNTTVVSNLGLSLARDFKKSVLIIDAHFYQAGVHQNFGLSETPGLVDVLSGQMALSQAVREVSPHLWVLAAGSSEVNPQSLLDSNTMDEILREAREGFEVVLIDCADLRHYRDAVSLGGFVEGIVLVVSEGKTRRPAIAAATAPLKDNHFQIIGTVFNNRTFALPEWIYRRV